MAQQNKTTLQSAINTQIADNTSGNITAANVRNNFINVTDSLVFNTGSQAITGSLTVTGGITGSLFGTATNAVTASYALTSAKPGRVKNVRIVGTTTTTVPGYGSYASFYTGASGSIYVGDLLVLEAPIDISLLVESPTTNRTAKMYISTSTSSLAGAFEIGQAAFGPSTSIVGKFERTILNKYATYGYSGGEDSYDRFSITYVRATGSSDTQISGSVVETISYTTNDFENALRYIIVDVPSGMKAYNLNVQSGV